MVLGPLGPRGGKSRKRALSQPQPRYELKSKLLKGGYMGDYIGTTIGVIKGDTRSLDYSSYGFRV